MSLARRRDITACLAAKMDEDLKLLVQMLGKLPPGCEEWRLEFDGAIESEAFRVQELSAHLVDACAAVCACFYSLKPQELAHFQEVQLRLSNSIEISLRESGGWVERAREMAAAGFHSINDDDLTANLHTHFSPQGEPFLSVLLSNWKHVHMHTYQLFYYLKSLGVEVSTRDLYRFVE